MSLRKFAAQCGVVCAFAATLARGETITWFNNPGATNLDAFGQPMDAGFEFCLGAFSPGFTPTSQNVGEWLAHWTAASATGYNGTTHRFASSYSVVSNPAPFTAGTAGWIFGKKQTNGVREWILFRRNTWNWPSPNPTNPFGVDWKVELANEVALGSVDPSGAPFLMKAALVSITYAEWQMRELAGEAKNAPNDDPDGDGESNLMEFAFDTNPLNPSSFPSITQSLLDGHPTYMIPRRADHAVDLVVEVSSNLVDWESGAGEIETLDVSHFRLTMRDLTSLPSAPGGMRFMRIRATLPVSPAE